MSDRKSDYDHDTHAELLYSKLNRIEERIRRITEFLEKIMAKIDDLVTVVTAAKAGVDAIVALVNTLESQVAGALANDNITPATQAKIDAVFQAATDQAAEINTALAAGTPAAPAKL